VPSSQLNDALEQQHVHKHRFELLTQQMAAAKVQLGVLHHAHQEASIVKQQVETLR